MEAVNFHQQIEHADFIITGEGKSDLQTLSGKAPIGIASVAKAKNIPVVLISGFIAPDSILPLSTHFDLLVSVTDDSVSQQESIENAEHYLGIRTKETMFKLLQK